MLLKKANLSHIDPLAGLFDAYRVFYGKDPNLEAAKLFLTQRIAGDESVIYIALSARYEALGFVQLYPLYSSTRMKKLWLLNDLFVAKEHRGQGISIRLIDAAKRLCEDTHACGLMLETEISNSIGNQLYPKTGFELDAAHNHYFWEASY